jgi:signal peptidase I
VSEPPATPVEQEHPPITSPPRRKKRRLHFLRELPVLVVIAFVLALLIKAFIVQAFYIPSGSMEPTLDIGDRVLVEKLFTHPHRGWIVVFTNPHPTPQPHRNPVAAFFHWLSEGFGVSTPANEDFIKRVIALPGQTVDIRHGAVYVDGTRVNEPYVSPVKDTSSFGPCRVPADRVFVMGDNRTQSSDSRVDFGTGAGIRNGRCVGAIRVSSIVGRAFVSIWPFSRIHWLG